MSASYTRAGGCTRPCCAGRDLEPGGLVRLACRRSAAERARVGPPPGLGRAAGATGAGPGHPDRGAGNAGRAFGSREGSLRNPALLPKQPVRFAAAVCLRHEPVNRCAYPSLTRRRRFREPTYAGKNRAGAPASAPGGQASCARLRPQSFAGQCRCRRNGVAQGTTARQRGAVARGRRLRGS